MHSIWGQTSVGLELVLWSYLWSLIETFYLIRTITTNASQAVNTSGIYAYQN